MKQKIVFSSYDDVNNPFYAGGGARAVETIARRLASDYEITVITGNYKGAKNATIKNVRYKRIGLSFLGPRLSQLLFHFLLPFSVMREEFAVWVESFTPPFSTSCLQLFTRKPVIGLVHMLASEDMGRKYKLPFHLWEAQGLKTYKYFIVLTEAFRKKIAAINPKANIFVIPNGVNKSEKRKAKSVKDTSRYLLFLGRIEVDQKGLDLLLAAYKRIAQQTGAKLVIAGSGCADDERALERLISDAGLTNQVMLVGRVSGAVKEKLLRDSLAVVVPSRFETFGVVALEAMMYGKPLVHFALEGLDWIPQNASIRVKPFSVPALAKAMHRVITDANVRQALAVAGQRAVKQYAWETIVEQYKHVLKRVLEDTRFSFVIPGRKPGIQSLSLRASAHAPLRAAGSSRFSRSRE